MICGWPCRCRASAVSLDSSPLPPPRKGQKEHLRNLRQSEPALSGAEWVICVTVVPLLDSSLQPEGIARKRPPTHLTAPQTQTAFLRPRPSRIARHVATRELPHKPPGSHQRRLSGSPERAGERETAKTRQQMFDFDRKSAHFALENRAFLCRIVSRALAKTPLSPLPTRKRGPSDFHPPLAGSPLRHLAPRRCRSPRRGGSKHLRPSAPARLGRVHPRLNALPFGACPPRAGPSADGLAVAVPSPFPDLTLSAANGTPRLSTSRLFASPVHHCFTNPPHFRPGVHLDVVRASGYTHNMRGRRLVSPAFHCRAGSSPSFVQIAARRARRTLIVSSPLDLPVGQWRNAWRLRRPYSK